MMKKMIYLLLITVLFTACKKKKNADSPTQNESCQISKIEDTNEKEKRILTLDYDDKGNVVKFVAGDKKFTQTYTYSKQSIINKEPSDDDGIRTTTYSLDDSGKITSAEESISKATGNTITKNITYNYTKDGYLSGYTEKNTYDNTILTTTYTWKNGNIISYQEGLNPTVSFEYGTETYPINFLTGDFEYGRPVFLIKYFGKTLKNLPSRITKGEGTGEYTYQKDDKGNITKVSRVFKIPKGKDESWFTVYHYNCK